MKITQNKKEASLMTSFSTSSVACTSNKQLSKKTKWIFIFLSYNERVDIYGGKSRPFVVDISCLISWPAFEISASSILVFCKYEICSSYFLVSSIRYYYF